MGWGERPPPGKPQQDTEEALPISIQGTPLHKLTHLQSVQSLNLKQHLCHFVEWKDLWHQNSLNDRTLSWAVVNRTPLRFLKGFSSVLPLRLLKHAACCWSNPTDTYITAWEYDKMYYVWVSDLTSYCGWNTVPCLRSVLAALAMYCYQSSISRRLKSSFPSPQTFPLILLAIQELLELYVLIGLRRKTRETQIIVSKRETKYLKYCGRKRLQEITE